MIPLTKKQRENLSKALFDISKLILTALVLGSFISNRAFDLLTFLIGICIFLLCFIIAITIDK
ncbi:MAG: DUF6722 family protein [bacterium]